MTVKKKTVHKALLGLSSFEAKCCKNAVLFSAFLILGCPQAFLMRINIVTRCLNSASFIDKMLSESWMFLKLYVLKSQRFLQHVSCVKVCISSVIKSVLLFYSNHNAWNSRYYKNPQYFHFATYQKITEEKQ